MARGTMPTSRFLVKRSAIFAGTLVATSLAIIAIAHSALDDIQRASIGRECNDQANTMKFKTVQDHDVWVKNCIEIKEKAAGIYRIF